MNTCSEWKLYSNDCQRRFSAYRVINGVSAAALHSAIDFMSSPSKAVASSENAVMSSHEFALSPMRQARPRNLWALRALRPP